MKIKIATFNVNSIKARLENVVNWLKNSEIDIALLQEIKCEEENFPFEEIANLGYNIAVLGQKTFNGVAILSKFKIEDVVKNLPNFTKDLGISSKKSKKKPKPDLFSDDFFENEEENEEDLESRNQARYIEAIIPINNKAIRVASIYVPNGGGEISENEKLEESKKFLYKMDFFDALKNHFQEVLKYDEITIFGGDFNVAAQNIDVYDYKNLDGKICFHELEKEKFRAILNLGLIDAFRALNPEIQKFSWWDYRGNSWQYDKGLRIDYLLASPQAFDKIIDCEIQDKNVRDQEKASDHCPIVVEIEI